MTFYNIAILSLEAAVYFFVLITLLHWHHRIGIDVFITVLGTMHFLETYLASAFYVPVPLAVISPGSVVFFTGKLLMMLLLYVKGRCGHHPPPHLRIADRMQRALWN